MEEKHWVEEVFRPVFTYSLAELNKKLSFTPPSSAQFQHWLSDRQKRPFPKARLRKSTSKKPTKANSPVIVVEKFEPEEDSKDFTEDHESEEKDEKTSSLWTFEELVLLRNDRDSAKRRTLELELENEDLERQVKLMKQKVDGMKLVLSRQDRVVEKLKRENEQLHIKLKQWRQKCTALDSDKNLLEFEKDRSVEALKKSQDIAHGLEMEKVCWDQQKKKLEDEVETLKRNMSLQLDQCRLTLERKHLKAVENLRSEIDSLKEKLEQSRLSHDRDKKALEHLRRHYSGEATAQKQLTFTYTTISNNT